MFSENNPFKKNLKEELKNENNEQAQEQEVAEEQQPAESETEPEIEVKEEVEEENNLQAQLDDLNNKYLRMAADFDNFRKRVVSEKENLLKYGAEETLKKVVSVLDNFERAKTSIKDIEDCKMVKESYEVCVKQLFDTLEKIGLTKIEAAGKEFDINMHEAVMQTPSAEYENNTVINELQAGYKLHDKVIRAAMVNVAVNEEG